MNTYDISNESLKTIAPSIFAESEHSSRSDRYSFLPTTEVLDMMRDDGWGVVMAAEQKIRNQARKGHQKHTLRFRRLDDIQDFTKKRFTDVVLVNAHDGSSSYTLHAGVFRMVCGNGMIVADSTFQKIQIRHVGFEPEKVINASAKIIEEVPRIEENIREFEDRKLEPNEAKAFAEAALIYRFDDLEDAPLSPEKVLEPRRHQDSGSDLWHTFNRVQENLIRGGQKDYSRRKKNGKRFPKTRPVKSIDGDIKLNKALWHLAETLKK